MTQTRPAAEAMAACRRGVSSGRQRSQCLRERWYSSTLHRCGDPFTTHRLPCTLCALMLSIQQIRTATDRWYNLIYN